MKDASTSLELLIERTRAALDFYEIADSTKTIVYERAFSKIVDFCGGRSGDIISDLNEFLNYVRKQRDSGKWTNRYCNAMKRAANLLIDCATPDPPPWRRYAPQKTRREPGTVMLGMIDASLESLGPKSLSFLEKAHRYLGEFGCFLEDAGLKGCSALDSDYVKEYLLEASCVHPNEMAYVILSLNHFLHYLDEQGICHVDIVPKLYRPASKGRKLIPAYTREEIRTILGSVDTKTVLGKRNMSIILLAITTGLRGCDIVELRLDDIDWQNGEMRITQQKTAVVLVLPLFPTVRKALEDYIVDGRPDIDDDHVFLTSMPPYRPFSGTGALSIMLERVCTKAGIKKVERRSFHSLRRSVATMMAEAGVPVQTIAQVLGHTAVNSVDPYIVFDPQTVAHCPLDFSLVPLAEGVFHE